MTNPNELRDDFRYDEYLIVGLGNPGREYKETRHNIGFMLLDQLAGRLNLSFTRMESRALVTKGNYQGSRLILAKPQTYMNLSGQAVGSLARYYKIPYNNLLVVYDDVDLPMGAIRIRASGGSGGHQGMNSIIGRLGTQDFPRMRLGIDRPPGRMDAADYVLQHFSKAEAEFLSASLDRAEQAVLVFISQGVDAAMNLYNAGAEES